MSALLEVTGVGKRYGGIAAIDGVSFSVGERELVCVIGPNGAGKSSLLNVMSGTLRPDSGDVRFDGRSLLGRPAHLFAKHGIVRKFQGANVFPWMTVVDSLEMAGLAVAMASGRAPPPVAEILSIIKLGHQAERLGSMCSHGQRQWLEIGMTLMCRPRVLLLDEPTAGMTAVGTVDMAELVLRLAGEMSVVVIEHDMSFVRRLGCRTIVMHQGRLIADGSFETVSQDERVRDAYLGRA
ncbi:MAG: ATP-binding cassette domain-containing protein [Alphaproteobacteria bacterium]|nr:ATP-binding cassette domain-containing protein [Alphaproteobacteria bacterium]